MRAGFTLGAPRGAVHRRPLCVQARARYVEVFNVMLYAAFMLREALALTQGRYEEMRGEWNRMVSDLAAARLMLQQEKEARAAEAAEHVRWREEAEAERDALNAEVADLRFQCKAWARPSASCDAGAHVTDALCA